MIKIDYSDVLKMEYPEVSKVGVLMNSGTRFSYFESFHKKSFSPDVERYILFDTRDLIYDWLLETK